MEFGLGGRPALLKQYAVTLADLGGGNFGKTTGTETFSTPFDSIPATCVIGPDGAAGDFEIQSVTTTGFTWNIQNADAAGVVQVGVFAHLKL